MGGEEWCWCSLSGARCLSAFRPAATASRCRIDCGCGCSSASRCCSSFGFCCCRRTSRHPRARGHQISGARSWTCPCPCLGIVVCRYVLCIVVLFCCLRTSPCCCSCSLVVGVVASAALVSGSQSLRAGGLGRAETAGDNCPCCAHCADSLRGTSCGAFRRQRSAGTSRRTSRGAGSCSSGSETDLFSARWGSRICLLCPCSCPSSCSCFLEYESARTCSLGREGFRSCADPAKESMSMQATKQRSTSLALVAPRRHLH